LELCIDPGNSFYKKQSRSKGKKGEKQTEKKKKTIKLFVNTPEHGRRSAQT
jgi:hypothetical protein